MNWKQENRLKIDPQSIFSLFDFTQLKTFEVFWNSSVVDVRCSLLVFVILLYYKIVLFLQQSKIKKSTKSTRWGYEKKRMGFDLVWLNPCRCDFHPLIFPYFGSNMFCCVANKALLARLKRISIWSDAWPIYLILFCLILFEQCSKPSDWRFSARCITFLFTSFYPLLESARMLCVHCSTAPNTLKTLIPLLDFVY